MLSCFFDRVAAEYASFMRSMRCSGPILCCLLLWGMTLAAQSARLAPEPLHIDALGKGTAKLDGVWQFHVGDDPAWASPALDDSQWEQLTANQPWGAQGHESYTGYAWYRRHLALSIAPGAAPDVALMIRHIDDAYEVYWNGQLVGSNGKLPPHPAWYNDQAAQTFGLGPLPGNQQDALIAIRVWKAPLFSYDNGEQGGFSVPPVIGSPKAIAALKAEADYTWLRGRQFTFALDFLYALVALLSLLAWLRDRRQWILFWMAGFSLAPLLILVLDGLRLPIPFDVSLGLQQPLYSLEDVSLWFLLVWLLQLEGNPRLMRLTWIAAAVNVGATTLDGLVEMIGWSSNWDKQAQIADALLTPVVPITEILPLFLIVFAVYQRRRLDRARWIVAICAFLTVTMSVIQVAAAQGSRFTHWTLPEEISAPLFTVNGNPISPYTLFRTLLVVALIYAIYRYSMETRSRRNTLEQEFKSARELQQVLIPETLPSVPGFALTSAYRPAQEVGGDFFQIIPLKEDAMNDGSTLIILGDVSGKGLKAAMAVALIVGTVRMIAEISSRPATVLALLNRQLCGHLQGGFATCVVLRLDADNRCFFSSAGHPSPFLNGQEMALPGALPLGLSSQAEYSETSVTLKIGDHLVLFTDGLLEARNPAGDLYGFERLEALCKTRPSAPQATETAMEFGQDDDITVLTLTRLAVGIESSSTLTLTFRRGLPRAS
jgi:hypothetical protein